MNAKQNYKWNELTMGTCYYPEHWDKKLWPDDRDREVSGSVKCIKGWHTSEAWRKTSL